MFPLLGGLITGGASLLGSMFSADTSAQNTQQQIAASQQQQATQNAFSERMSSTAYQRASQDMQAAGLNPAMMFGSGSAASSPTGSGIQTPTPQTKSPLGDLGSNVGRGIDAMVSAKSMEKTTEEIANLKVENAKLAADVDLSRATASERTQHIKNLAVEQRLKELGIPPAQVSSQSAKDILSMPSDIREGINRGLYQDKHFGGAVGGAIGAVKHTAKSIRNYFDSQDGSSFDDRFGAAYRGGR